MSKDPAHAKAFRQLLEIYTTFLPNQRAEVSELIVAGVPTHKVASLYPLDWQYMVANLWLPRCIEGDALDTLISLRHIYFGVEDNLNEVEGGVYGAAGTWVRNYVKTVEFAVCQTRIMNQLPAVLRDYYNRNIVEDALSSIYWYTWSFANWHKLGDAADAYSAKSALIAALDQVTELMGEELLEEDSCAFSGAVA